jgi:hypothetical protein
MGWREWYNDQALEQQEEFDEVVRTFELEDPAKIEMIWAYGQYKDSNGQVRAVDPIMNGALLDYWLTGGRATRPVLAPGVYAMTLDADSDRKRELSDLLLARWLTAHKGSVRLTGWNPAPGVDYELQVLRPVIQAAGISGELVAPAAGSGPVVLDETAVVGDGATAMAVAPSWNALALVFAAAGLGILVFRK